MSVRAAMHEDDLAGSAMTEDPIDYLADGDSAGGAHRPEGVARPADRHDPGRVDDRDGSRVVIAIGKPEPWPGVDAGHRLNRGPGAEHLSADLGVSEAGEVRVAVGMVTDELACRRDRSRDASELPGSASGDEERRPDVVAAKRRHGALHAAHRSDIEGERDHLAARGKDVPHSSGQPGWDLPALIGSPRSGNRSRWDRPGRW